MKKTVLTISVLMLLSIILFTSGDNCGCNPWREYGIAGDCNKVGSTEECDALYPGGGKVCRDGYWFDTCNCEGAGVSGSCDTNKPCPAGQSCCGGKCIDTSILKCCEGPEQDGQKPGQPCSLTQTCCGSSCRAAGQLCCGGRIACSTKCCGMSSSSFCAASADTNCCDSNSDCDDSNVCNGMEICIPTTGICVPGAPLNCNDGDPCTVDTCDPKTGCLNTGNPKCGDICCPDTAPKCCGSNSAYPQCYDPALKACCDQFGGEGTNNLLCNPGQCCIYQPARREKQFACIDKTSTQCCLERICPAGDECCGEKCCVAGSTHPYCARNVDRYGDYCAECTNNLHCDDGDPCTEDVCVESVWDNSYICLHNGCSVLNQKMKCVINDFGQKVCAACETFDRVQCDITDKIMDRIIQWYDETSQQCKRETEQLTEHCGTDPCEPSQAGETKKQCIETKLMCKRQICQLQNDGSYTWVSYDSEYCQGGTCQDNVPAGDCSCLV